MAIYKRWGRNFRTNDEADAFILAMIDKVCYTGQMGELPNYQKMVIEELLSSKLKRRKVSAS